MKTALLLLVLAPATLLAQQPKPQTPPAPAAPQVVAPAQSEELKPKESVSALKLQLALQTEKSLALQAQTIQQSIEPQMAPLRQQYSVQEPIISQEVEAVKKENGWGSEVSVDRNPQSPNYGKFVKAPVTPVPPTPPAPKK